MYCHMKHFHAKTNFDILFRQNFLQLDVGYLATIDPDISIIRPQS